MNNYDFLDLLIDNISAYFAIFIFLGIFYYFLFRKVVHTVIDPLFWSILFSLFGFADVVLMFFTGAIKPYYFLSYLLTQGAFTVGMLSLSKFENTRIKMPPATVSLPPINNANLIAITLLYAGIQLYVYYAKGIPLLYDSRLEYYTGGSGFGIFSRILDVLPVFLFYSLFEKVAEKKITKNFRSYLFYTFGFCFYFATLVLSGSKSSILIVAYTIFCYYYINRQIPLVTSIWKRFRFVIIPGALFFVLLIITVQSLSQTDAGSPVISLIYRFVASGDVYWYTYPNDVIYTYKPIQNGWLMMSNDFLGFFRIMDWASFQEYPGVYFYKYHHDSDLIQGANMRHNVFGLLYFGFAGSIIYSFFLGLLVSFIRFFMPRMTINNSYFKFACVYLLLKCNAIEADMTLFITYINNLVIVLIMIIVFNLFITSLFYYPSKKWAYRL
ncbi:hypothetical protein GFS24_17495 [Chitinophaga sp. SYP-B3965]|uniref:O-antigen polymerase n=1 Tax=Chitinophaga sp. SYP-B3965 TaxID=2663120 RepID=UPI001299B97A|nr:O-antigen polymerase [Chitinophaga sp. SYP-B3965]MRG46920.1 hypothetical protein [Chitinophaga sp. SYP-B3965]